MRRLIDWLRYQGWRNVYWREDAAIARCDHTDIFYDQIGGLCVHCGKPMGSWADDTATSASSTNTRYKLRITL